MGGLPVRSGAMLHEAATIKELLCRVLEAAHVAEVTVVDDASTNGTLSVVGSIAYSRLKMLRQDHNRGKGDGITARLQRGQIGLRHRAGCGSEI